MMDFLEAKEVNIFQVKKEKVENYMKTLKRQEAGGGNKMNLQDLFDTCDMTVPCPDPEDAESNDWLDQPFCVDVKGTETANETLWFHALFSTPRLISLHEHGRPLHADGTYKLNWMNFPVILAGTSDVHLRFHPTLLGITFSEKKEDYMGIFEALKAGYMKVTGKLHGGDNPF